MIKSQIIQTITKLRVGRIGKIIAGFVVTVLTVGIVSLLFTTDTTAGWFDDAWGFRRHIAFTHNADIGSERRVTITIDTATPISTSKMQSACQDVRFTDINGLLLSYQLTGTCNNASTTFDVVFPTIVNGSNPVYVYYGNFAASSASQDVSAVTSLSPSGSPAIGSEEKSLGPVLYLKFDEGYGTTVIDTIHNRNNGIFPSNVPDVKIATTRITANTSTGTQDIITTDLNGDTPKAAIFIATLATTNGTAATHARISYGAATGTSNRWVVSTRERDAASGGGDPRITAATNQVIRQFVTSSGTYETVAEADFSSFITNGVRINWTKATSDAFYVTVILFSGSDLNAHVGNQAISGASTYNITAPGFEPSMLFTANAFVGNTPAFWYGGIGLANNMGGVVTQRVLLQNGAASGGASVQYNKILDNRIAGRLNPNGTTRWTGVVEDFDSDGFSLTTTGTSPDTSFLYLALDLGGVSSWVGTHTTPTATGNYSEISPGFTPKFVYQIMNFAEGFDTAYTDNRAGTFGFSAISSTNQFANSVSIEDGVTTSNAQTLSENIAVQIPDDDGATGITGSYVSFDDDGWTTNYTNVTTTGKRFLSLAIEDTFLPGSDPLWQSEDMCISGKCLYFNGDDSVFHINNSPSIQLDEHLADGFTIQGWVRPNSLGGGDSGQIFNKGTNTYLRLVAGSNSSVANLEASLDLATTNATTSVTDGITLNRWHHIAMVYDGGTTVRLYIDGQLRSSSNNGVGTVSSDNSSLLVGGPEATNFHGFIDAFKIYPYQRNGNQIKSDTVRGAASLTGLTARFGPDDSWLSDGLVGYWEMDEASIPNDCSTLAVLDSSGNGFDGRACPVSTGPTGGNTGKFGNGITLNTSGHRIEIPDDPAIRFNSGDFSIFLWSYKTSVTATSILNKLDGGNDGYTLRTLATGRIRFQMNATFGDSASILPTNTWTHIGVVVRDGFAQIYINGVPDGSPIDMTAVALDTTAVLIFGDNATNFSGTMDETRFYNRALTPSEVDGLYNWAPGPVGYWKFDENTGTDVNDLSGNGNTGTLTNSGWAPAKYGSGMTGKIDNVQDYTNIPDPTSGVLDFGITDNFTIGFWSKVTLLEGNTYIVHKNWTGSPSAAGYGIVYSHAGGAGNVRAGYSNGTSADDVEILGAGINNGEWRYVTVVMDRTGEATGFVGFHVYIDGRLRGSDTSLNGTGSGVNSAPLRIGEDSTAGEFDGIIDDVRIYNYPRSQGQIIQDMNAGHPLGGSPVGSQTLYWKLDEGYGTTANDSSATGAYNGTLSSGVVWANEGKIGKAVNISTTARYVSAGDVAFVDGATTMTWSLWVNPQSLSTNSSILSKSNYSNQNNFGIRTDATNSDEIRVYIASSASDTSNYFTTSDLDLATGVWQHLLVVYDGTASATNRVKVYKDGRAVSGSITGTIPTSLTSGTTSELRLGRSMASNDSLIAHFDEVKIYAGALSLENALIDMTHGSATILGAIGTESDGLTPSFSASREYCVPGDTATCSPPTHEYKMDENTGTTAYDTGSASTKRDGTLVSGPEYVPGRYGAGIQFDGVGSYLSYGAGVELYDETAAFSISSWVYIRSFSSDVIILCDQNEAYTCFFISSNWQSITDGLHYCGSNDCATEARDGNSSSNVISVGRWYHVGMTYNGSNTCSFYVDGVNVTEDAVCGETSGSYDHEVGGTSASSTFSDAIIDNLRIYDYVRTPAQMAWEYNRGGPIGWWRFDECTGTTAYDASGNGNNGTLNLGASGQTSAGDCGTNANTAWYNGREGKFNASLNFDGTDDKITITNNSTINVNDEFSYAAWIKLPATPSGNSPFIGKGDVGMTGSTSKFIALVDTNGQVLTAYRAITGNLVSTSTVDDNQWHHVAYVYSNSQNIRTLYINGVAEASSTSLDSSTTDTSDLTIGSGTSLGFEDFFNGQIDDVRIYNYALSEAQIRTIMNYGAVRFGE